VRLVTRLVPLIGDSEPTSRDPARG